MKENDRKDAREHDLKISDRRMFTPEGELKEEFRWVEEEAARRKKGEREADTERTGGETPAPPAGPPSSSPPGDGPPAAGKGDPQIVSEAGPTEPVAGTPWELPDTPEAGGRPSFLDLVAVLAEPATIYMGEAPLPDGRTTEDLRLARLYIDLLALLREKTNGNLSLEERNVLDNLLYRLQMRYVEKRG